jgi:hypothetical protein
MTDQRPIAGASELRQRILATDTTIPVISTNPFRVDARKKVGNEFVVCTGFATDAFGWPVMTGCQRGVSREEGGVAAREWPAETPVTEVPWTTIEIVTTIPVPTLAMVGRQFLYKDAAGNVYTFNVVISPAGDPVIDWINEPPTEEPVEGVFSLDILQKLNVGLTGLNGIAVASDGSFVITRDTPGGGSVETEARKHTLSNAVVWTIQDSGVSTGNDMRHAMIHPSVPGKWFVDLNYSIVGRYNYTTGAEAAETLVSTTFGDINPGGMASDGTTLWITDTRQDYVRYYPISTLVETGHFGSLGSATGQFNNPTDIAYSSGKLYVLDAGNGRVQRFDAITRVFEMAFGSPGNAPGQISNNADSLVVDTLGRIWVSDTGNHRVSLYDSAGVFIADAGSLGTGLTQFNSPRQLALGTNGVSVHVVDRGNKRIMTVQEHVDLNLALNYQEYNWDEEFIGGGTASGAIGERGWAVAVGAGASVSVQSSTSAHPGINRLAVPATTGTAINVSLGPWVLGQIKNMAFIFAPASNGNLSSLRAGVGLSGGTTKLNGAQPSEGVSAEIDTGASGSFMTIAKHVANVSTKTVTTVPFVAGEYYLAELKVTNVGEVTVRLVRLATAEEQTVVLTGVSTATAFDASFFCRTLNAVTKSIDTDYWSGSFGPVSRV